MSQFLKDNWYVFVLVSMGIVGLWFGLSSMRQSLDNHKPRSWSLIWGPFTPAVDNYLLKRGGFTTREKLGWLVVILLMLGVFISTFFVEY